MDALVWFFVAVILVILGTYACFIAGSVVVLKLLLRRMKGYYYKTNHFISVGGMLHRMKQNGAGLATICILSTMVLVMVSGTASLYVGNSDILHNRYPRDQLHLPGRRGGQHGRRRAGQPGGLNRPGPGRPKISCATATPPSPPFRRRMPSCWTLPASSRAPRESMAGSWSCT